MNLDLNIKHYKIKDLENFFKLPLNYIDSDLDLQEKQITDTIQTSDIDRHMKVEIMQFIEQARNILKDKNPSVTKPEIQFVYSKPEEFVTGKMNPIDKRVTTKSICIDTLFRTNYSKTKSTDFLYVLPVDLNKVVSIQMSSFEIPNMWNSYSSQNKSNMFEISAYNVNTGILDDSGYPIYSDMSYSFIIPDGNYFSDTFPVCINNIFQNSDLIGVNFLTLEISPQTNTIIRARNSLVDKVGPYPYDVSGAFYSPDFYFTLNFAIQGNQLYKNAGWMMGFRQEKYVVTSFNTYTTIDSSTIVNYQTYLISESSFGSTIDNYVFLEVNDFHNNFPTDTIMSTNQTSYLGNNILARIVLTSGATTTVWNNAGDLIFKKREYFGPIKLEKLNIRILNRFGDVLDLRQNDYSFVLEITQIY